MKWLTRTSSRDSFCSRPSCLSTNFLNRHCIRSDSPSPLLAHNVDDEMGPVLYELKWLANLEVVGSGLSHIKPVAPDQNNPKKGVEHRRMGS
jgi:hypothetical protein